MSAALSKSQEFRSVLEFIKRTRGFDFTGYKPASLIRRISKRTQDVGFETFGGYLDYLEVHPEEFAFLFDTILINVTAFFRDREAWNHLATDVIPQIITSKPVGQPLRIWSAGCASGEEAYTLAIVLAEALGMGQFQQRVKIYATDVDERSLSHARLATYSARDLEPVPAALRDKYFESAGNSYVFRTEPRRAVIFGRHDLIQDAPISRLDLLVCRNTLMYFNAETQTKILARFHFALNDPGFLFLGKAEMLLTHANLFAPANMKFRLFAKVPKLGLREHLPVLAQAGNLEATNVLSRYIRLRDAALDAAPAAQVVVDALGNLVLANEQARTLFSLSPKDIGRSWQDLELFYRPLELRPLIEQVVSNRQPITLRDVRWSGSPEETRHLDVQVVPLVDEGGDLLGSSIVFIEASVYHQLREELQRSNQELETAYEELQSTNEELETTNEELQSTVEELETTNEELQSTNEEMETMNEELQSTNAELQTANEELQHSSDQLAEVNAFLESILGDLRTAVIVVDRTLSVLMWNHRAEDLWGLRPEEVRGKFFLNLDIGLPVEHLAGPLRAVLAGELESREVVLDATNRRGKLVQCRVVCTPLRGAGQENQGAILLLEEWEGDQARLTQDTLEKHNQ